MTVVRPGRTRCAGALHALVCGSAAMLVACGTSHPAPPGTPVVTMGNLTNSGDFASYIVNLDAIELTRNDGTVVTPWITPTAVDLAKLNTVTELVEAPAVPEGTYLSALIALDWTSTPQVWLNQNGQTVAATPTNNTGTAMTTANVVVTFDPAHPLVITHNVSTRLQVEIDLLASNQLTAAAVVQVQPFAVVTPAPVDSTVLRLRGLYVTTQQVTSGFYMNSRPFYDLVSAVGAVIVNTNAKTYFSINGTVYTGAAGLSAIAQQQQNSPLVAWGTLDNLSGVTPTFNATEVYFGTSQESQLAYYLTGVVSARSDNTLTLRAVDFVTPIGTTAYIDSVPVTIGTGTSVFEDGIATPGLTIANVSVGQVITVAGQPSIDSSGTLVGLDATAGFLRLRPTTLWGMQNADATLDLASLGSLAPAVFNFAGTGLAGHDATPTAYAVDTSAVPPGPVTTTGELLQMQGTVAPFGAAPPDFRARALTAGPSSLQTLVIDWVNGGSAHPFTSISAAGLLVNLADPDLGTTHEIRTGPATLDLMKLPASPLITTVGAADQNNLQLAVGSTSLTKGISVFNEAESFAAAVTADFSAGTNKIFRLVAYGQYDSASNTFVASRIHVALHE
ncbi:MAG: hypothetical protein JO203_07525 [Gammaproteobacteria bacterium]|nr:hypothetical protein [Gammaproteobacteria bacterium]